MSKKYIISAEEAEEIRAYRESVTDKYLDRRLYAVQLLGEGMKPKDIAEKLDADKRQISRWASQFCNGGGIKGLVPKTGGRGFSSSVFLPIFISVLKNILTLL